MEAENAKDADFISGEYFVSIKRLGEHPLEDADAVILNKFDELDILVKYHYESTGAYCVFIDNPDVFKELSSLEYVFIEKAGMFRALDSEVGMLLVLSCFQMLFLSLLHSSLQLAF